MTNLPSQLCPPGCTSFVDPATGFALDLRGMDLSPDAIAVFTSESSASGQSPLARAHAEMIELEEGHVKNPDEGRRVTHFTDRLHYPHLPVYAQVEELAAKVREGTVWPDGRRVTAVVVNGVGGSALGPQLLQFAINGPYWNEQSAEKRKGMPAIYFLDNTDPAGVVDLCDVLDLDTALVVTISKGGNTRETLNNLRALEQAFGVDRGKPDFARHAVAITMGDSVLFEYAEEQDWLAVFEMAESIGGRTSVSSVVGHVPAALTGIDFAQFLTGACHMDELTRVEDPARNPAYQLAMAWHIAGNGRGDRNMVLVPYSDRLLLLGRYLQQLVMESLGKELDLDGNVVHQGLTVYGNKGGTDAHAYIQQLNDGRDDFFITFIELLRDHAAIEVGNGLTMGDYLHAFKDGLVNALRAKGRKVAQIIMESLDEFSLGMLIALYERAVAVYAELIHINAFHQPGVQAYKLASGEVNAINLKLQHWVAGLGALPWCGTAAQAATAIGRAECEQDVHGLLSKFAANERVFGDAVVRRAFTGGAWQFHVEQRT